jgi:hypothetical protein
MRSSTLWLWFVAGCGVQLELPALPDFSALGPDEDLVAARQLVEDDLAVLRSLELFDTDGLIVTDAMRPELCGDAGCEEARIERFVGQATRLHALTATAVEVSGDLLLQCSVYVSDPFERTEVALDALAGLQIVHVGAQADLVTRQLHEQQAILCGLAERSQDL